MPPFEELTSLLATTITAFLAAHVGIVRTEEFGALIVALKIIGGITTGLLILGILYLIIKDRKVAEKIEDAGTFINANPFKNKK